MNTRLRLLAMALTCAGLFSLSWFLFVRERPQQAELPPKAKTTGELLIGTWDIVEQDPPQLSKANARTMFTKDGKAILRVTEVAHETSPELSGTYQLEGETIRFDYPESADHPHTVWMAKIETITEDTLVLIGLGDNPTTRRAVCRRVRDNGRCISFCVNRIQN